MNLKDLFKHKNIYFNVRKFRVQKISRIRPFAKFCVLMEFNFANQQDEFISQELNFTILDFSSQKHWKNKLKNLFLCSNKQEMTKKIWKLCLLGINFRESAKRFFSRDHLISRIEGSFAKFAKFSGREIFWH